MLDAFIIEKKREERDRERRENGRFPLPIPSQDADLHDESPPSTPPPSRGETAVDFRLT